MAPDLVVCKGYPVVSVALNQLVLAALDLLDLVVPGSSKRVSAALDPVVSVALDRLVSAASDLVVWAASDRVVSAALELVVWVALNLVAWAPSVKSVSALLALSVESNPVDSAASVPLVSAA